jgi:hypothetical protein
LLGVDLWQQQDVRVSRFLPEAKRSSIASYAMKKAAYKTALEV